MTNGEKYKTIKERGEAFGDFCKVKTDCKSCPAYTLALGCGSDAWCEFAWLEMEADEENEKQG